MFHPVEPCRQTGSIPLAENKPACTGRSSREVGLARRTAFAGAMGLAFLVATPAVFAYREITWQWAARQRSNGDTVAQDAGTLDTSPSSPSIVLDEPKGFVAGVAALSTAMEFSVDGNVNPATRSIGAGVESFAKETPSIRVGHPQAIAVR